VTAARSVDAVLLDFHGTLVHQHPARRWVAAALAEAGRGGTADQLVPTPGLATLLDGLDRLWERASAIDPGNLRDLDGVRHREVFDELVGCLPGVDDALTDALYATMLDEWTPWPDTLPTLRALAGLGVRTAVLSNVGVDIRPVLRRTGIADLVDAVVLSFEHGAVKPDPELFRRALAAVGAAPDRALMVGDNWRDDGAAAALGVRTLILPARPGERHHLGTVLGLVTAED